MKPGKTRKNYENANTSRETGKNSEYLGKTMVKITITRKKLNKNMKTTAKNGKQIPGKNWVKTPMMSEITQLHHGF